MPRLARFSRFLVVLLVASLAVVLLLDTTWGQAAKGKKYALVVGVRDYDSTKFAPLRYTENDADEMAKVLRTQGGFRVRLLTSSRGKTNKADRPTGANIRNAIKSLLAKKTRDDTVLVALAGHGIQGKLKDGNKEIDESFFCPSDSQLNDTRTLLALGKLFTELDDCGAAVKLLLVDACRNDPKMGRNVDIDNLPRLPRGSAALFSCKAGERAFETDKLPGGKGHGIFFYHVLKGLTGKAKNDKGEITWARLTEYVTDAVSDEVPTLIGEGAKQTPELKVNLTGKSPVLVVASKTEVGRDKGKDRPSKEKPGKEPIVKSRFKEIVNSIEMRLVAIPASKFQMGTPAPPGGPILEEKQHEVHITKPFWMGVHEVTQWQFRTVMGYNPSVFCARNNKGKKDVKYPFALPGSRKDMVVNMETQYFPVENVLWEEADAFCKNLTARAQEKRAGRRYRLPTEAEWEYACRGGATSFEPFHFGKALPFAQANFRGNPAVSEDAKKYFLGRTCKVGSFKPNGFGLHDMHGNVEEWCSDWYDKDYYKKRSGIAINPENRTPSKNRVVRGGSWDSNVPQCRSAARHWRIMTFRAGIVGFRVVMEPVRR